MSKINSAVAGELFADDGGDEAGGEHAVGDASAKDGVLGVGFVEVHRVAVGRDFCKHFNVLIGHDFAQCADHADFDVFDADGAAHVRCPTFQPPLSNKTPIEAHNL